MCLNKNKVLKWIKKTHFMMMFLLIELVTTSKLPWDRWSWDSPQQPIAYFFRRHQQMPIKRPDSHCKCPPHKECTIEYKLNEDALQFLSMQGLINNTQFQQEDQIHQHPTDLVTLRKKRDVNEKVTEENCCCPTSAFMMHTFITDKKFDDFVDRFDKKQDPPLPPAGV